MYKLLLATDDTKVIEAFRSISSWESKGFRAPRIVGSAEEAMASLARHHADGIAIEFSEAEAKHLVLQLIEKYPLLSVMRASDDPAEVAADLSELSQLLNQLYADYSNDRYSLPEMMQLIRHEYFRKLISGRVADPDAMVRHLRLLRSRMDTDRACVLVELGLPDDDGYLADHWRYGADRLEVAMRNIFGAELEGMRILVSVLPDERLFLLACPMVGETAPGVEEGLMDVVLAQTNNSIGHVREYLNIDLRITGVSVLPALTALCTGTN